MNRDQRTFSSGAYGLPPQEPEPAPAVKWDGIAWVPCDKAPEPPVPKVWRDGVGWVPLSEAGPIAKVDWIQLEGDARCTVTHEE